MANNIYTLTLPDGTLCNLRDSRVDTIPGTTENIVDLIYPIGSLFINTTSIDPNSLFENTSWTRIKDRFLLSAGDIYEGGTSAGSADAIVPYHRHGVSITSQGMSANVSHTHKPSGATNYPNFVQSGGAIQSGDMGTQSGSGRHYPFQSTTTSGKYWAQSTTTAATNTEHTHNVSGNTAYEGNAVEGANMPPYLAVYVWQRTA